jgi:hypothetical protein
LREQGIFLPEQGIFFAGAGNFCGARLHPLDDADLPIGSAGELGQRFLIGGTVVRGPRGFHAVKLEQHRALLEAGLVDMRRRSAGQETPAGGGVSAGPASLA